MIHALLFLCSFSYAAVEPTYTQPSANAWMTSMISSQPVSVQGGTVSVTNSLNVNTHAVYPVGGSFVVTPGTGTYYTNFVTTFTSGDPGYIRTVGTTTVEPRATSSWWVYGGTVTTQPMSTVPTWVYGGTVTIQGPVYPVGGSFVVTPGTGSFNQGSYTVTPGTGAFALMASSMTLKVLDSAGSVINVGYNTGASSVPVSVLGGTITVVPTVNGYFQVYGGTVATRDLKDANRTRVIISTVNQVSVGVINMSTFSYNKGGVITNGATSYTVTSGKTLRLQTLVFNTTPNIPSTTVTFASTTFIVTEGQFTTSPIVFSASLLMQTNIDTPPTVIPVPDGLEFPAGTVIGVAHKGSANTIREEFALIGYEY